MSAAGRVGIFWAVPDAGTLRLVTRATALDLAEPYGDFLTHSEGHFDVWEAWQALGPAGLIRHGLPGAIAAFEYEDCPRGRVVFHRPDRRFIAYADRVLHEPVMRASILAAFGLPAQTRLLADAHYSTRSLPGDSE